MNSRLFAVAPRVREALDHGRPVVALESTIIAHGMPYPANVETALAVESIVREHGAEPATLGVLDGQIIAGMSPAEITCIGSTPGVVKACERDLPWAVATRANAAVTAGASVAIAAACGIRVFVTGGIGGVGLEAANDFDISADLPALALHPVLTVCAGAKAFMDIAATLQFLETWRVPVATLGAPDYPLFYTRQSGVPSPWNAQSEDEVARVFAARLALGQQGGLLCAVPVPAAHELPAAVTAEATTRAWRESRSAGLAGKDLTPFLLARVAELTGGESLAANIALIRNNARAGAAIAGALVLYTRPS
ncbi:MAG: pseudouridine-5'-phosphate glycosidase [Acidobacteria bacterium]|nr:pseudouridine-5'-phosphate glycosidase [Acidobacteriota bacterium]